MNIELYYILSTIITIVVVCGLALLYLEQETIKEYFQNKNERLVGIIRVPFLYHSAHITNRNWDELPSLMKEDYNYADVYCYENRKGKRKLNINPYAYSGSHSYIKQTEPYSKLLDWRASRSNLYNFPSYGQVMDGSDIVRNFS